MTLRIGLIADTHIPERWPRIPSLVEEHFSGVDLILHAGDVGELWVLDALGSIAPVVAVHGNDETEEAAVALPYEQLLGLAGRRVLLCHSHQPERAAEMASRKSDEWEPKLRGCAAQAKRHGASIYVYGHTHIPMAQWVDGVLLLNPGAIASGNAICRQTVQTIATLEIAANGELVHEHYRVDDLGDHSIPDVDLSAGFGKALSSFSEMIATPEVQMAYRRARLQNLTVEPELQEVVLRVARRCWSRELSLMDADSILAEAEADDRLGPELTTKLRSILGTG
ncbi:MAG: YfcE family phosphodiesterase [Gemmatimonadetes bacterium]|jgi:uncharacterized protein|nr:YfcE family phosphodiesterase [Gemmatimonadota bacterium]